MKVNSINQNLNFKRAIIIQSKNNDYESDRIPKEITDICNVLNGYPSKGYSKESSKKIKNFFHDVLGDYDYMNPVIVEKSLYGDIVLFSGKEAEQIQDLRTKVKKSIKRYETDKKLKPSKRKRMINQAINSVKTAVQYRIEDGRKGKPESIIEIESLSNKNGSKKIAYTSYQTSFTKPQDGHINKKEGEKSIPHPGINFKNVTCEYMEIIV